MKKSRRGLLILAIPLLSLAGLGAILAVRPPGATPVRRPVAAVRAEEPAAAASPRSPVSLAPAASIEEAVERSRIESTFQNYRTAIATGNVALEAALRPILMRDADSALTLARSDLAGAGDAYEQDVARRVLESLRR